MPVGDSPQPKQHGQPIPNAEIPSPGTQSLQILSTLQQVSLMTQQHWLLPEHPMQPGLVYNMQVQHKHASITRRSSTLMLSPMAISLPAPCDLTQTRGRSRPTLS